MSCGAQEGPETAYEATTLLLPFIPSPMGTQAPRLPEAAEVGVLAGGGWAELLVSAIRHGLLALFSLLTSSSAALGSGMGWLMPSSSSWACCLLRATWKHRAASHHTPLPSYASLLWFSTPVRKVEAALLSAFSSYLTP